MVFLFKNETPKFLIIKGDNEGAKKELRKIYYLQNGQIEDILGFACKSIQKKTCKIKLKSALFDKVYRIGTWIVIILIIFHELSGINVIMIYSTTIFQEINEEGGSITPRVGSYIVGIVNCLSSLFSIYIVKKFMRRSLLMVGHIAMALCHVGVAFCKQLGYDIGTVIMINLFLISYEWTTGPIAWIYTSEIVVDSAFGCCIFTLYFTVLVLSFATPYMMSSFLQA